MEKPHVIPQENPEVTPARTDEQIIGRVPMMVNLGGKEYPIHPLSIAKSREWRAACSKTMDCMVQNIDLTNIRAEEMVTRMRSLMLIMPTMVNDLVFSYAPNLPKEIIEEEATDQELFAVLVKIFAFAYPFAQIRSLFM